MSDVSSRSSAGSTFLIDFLTIGVRVCDSANPVTFEGRVYKPDPSIELRFSPITGGLEDRPLKIAVSLTSPVSELSALASAAVSMRSMPSITVLVTELATRDGKQEKAVRFIGTLDVANRNPDERNGVVQFQIFSLTSTLDESLGRPILAECDAAYGSRLCGIDISPYPGSGTNHQARHFHSVKMSFAQRGVVVQLTEASGLNEGVVSSLDKWSRGFVRDAAFDHRLPIREYRPLTNTFVLMQRPPADWQFSASGKLLQLWPGCLKTPEACSARGNTALFGGLGLATPAYNPAYEEDGR